jgi:hypothetical protein
MYISLFASTIYCDDPKFAVTKGSNDKNEVTITIDHDRQTINFRMKDEDIVRLYAVMGDYFQFIANEKKGE